MDVAYLVNIYGRVTGVGFRYSAINYARNFSFLKGYVRNVDYGEVEALVQGKKEDVDKMVSWLSQGPSMARVDDIKINEVPVDPKLGYFDIGW